MVACSKAEQPLPHRFEIHTEEGLPTAVNNGTPKYPGEILAYEEILRIREDPEVPASLLHRPDFRYVRDKAGCFYIADSRGQRIVVFDSAGGSLPFGGNPDVLYLSGGRILRSTGEQPLIEFFDLEGRPLSRIRFDFQPEPVTEAERREILASLKADADSAQAGQEGAFERAVYRAVKFPETKAFWSGVEVDDKGYFWLRCAGALFTQEAEDPDRFMLLSPEGEYLGITGRPGFMGSISTGHLLAWDVDRNTGALIPVIYRITSAIDGFEYP